MKYKVGDIVIVENSYYWKGNPYGIRKENLGIIVKININRDATPPCICALARIYRFDIRETVNCDLDFLSWRRMIRKI